MTHIASHQYRWVEPWTQLPDSDTGWAHHGLATLANGNIVSGHSTRPELFELNGKGQIQRRISLPVSEIHHISVDTRGDTQILWVCDLGDKDLDPAYRSEPRVVAFDLEGRALTQIGKAALGYGENQPFKPTASAVDAANQRLWIADGYGSSLVHCLDRDGNRLFSLDGSEGAGRFDCPHTVFVDNRQSEARILVADRSNHRVQCFSANGEYLRLLNIPNLTTPSAFAIIEEHLLVVELEARVHELDENDGWLRAIFDGSELVAKEGWPNRRRSGELQAPKDLKPGTLNSPHSLCVDDQLNIYISEWMIGDRFIKLERCLP